MSVIVTQSQETSSLVEIDGGRYTFVLLLQENKNVLLFSVLLFSVLQCLVNISIGNIILVECMWTFALLQHGESAFVLFTHSTCTFAVLSLH